MRDAVIFDMDGLLLETEKIALKTFRATCSLFDIRFNQTLYDTCLGRNLQDTEGILTRNIPAFPGSAFMTAWKDAYHEEAVVKPVPLKPGVRRLLSHLQDSGIPCAVATSSGQRVALRKLDNAGIIDQFRFVVSGDQVTRSKPDPEIYLTAARRIGTAPEHCLALEDSDNGVRAAHAANMLVFQIPDLVAPSADVRQLGHQVLPSLIQVYSLFKNPA